MKLLSTVAAGVLLLAGCAPFQHGHYEQDTHYINDVGDPPGTPVVVHTDHYDDPYYQAASATTYSEPVYSEPAPVVHSAPVYSEPAPVVHHAPVIQAAHSAPVYAPPPVRQIQVAPAPVQVAAPLPIARPEPAVHQHVEVNLHVDEKPRVVASTVSTAPEHYQHETVFAPPQVINAPPVFVRNGRMANQPFPEPPYPSFGAPALPSFGYGGFGGYPGAYGGVVPSTVRAPYGGGCVIHCGSGSTVF